MIGSLSPAPIAAPTPLPDPDAAASDLAAAQGHGKALLESGMPSSA